MYSEKGGVGKTSITNGTAAAAAKRGLNVVVVDGDPRATATDELGVLVLPSTLTLNDLLFIDPRIDDPPDPREVIGQVVHPAGPDWPGNVRVIPSERNLANREGDFNQFDHRLKLGLSALEDADLVLCDCPPRAGGRLISTLLIAADVVVLPSTLTTDGAEGVRNAFRTLKLTKQGANPSLRELGILRSDVPRDHDRRLVHDAIDQLLEDTYPGHVLPAQIPHFVVREECRFAHVPITSASGKPAQIMAEAYDAVVGDLLAAVAA
jgi:chromosome partitioning protein